MTGADEKEEQLTFEQAARRRQRNIAMALALGLLAVLFYAVTFVKGPGAGSHF